MGNIVNMALMMAVLFYPLFFEYTIIYADSLVGYHFQNLAKNQNGSGARELESSMFL